jgi:hypothetical protein
MTSTATREMAGRGGAAAGLAIAALLCLIVGAASQQPTSPPSALTVERQQQPPADAIAGPEAPPERTAKGGVFEAIGRWIGRPLAGIKGWWKVKSESASEQTNGPGGLLPNANIVSGRERCEIAANGAPDCRRAIETLCRSKGFSAGKSLDVQQVERCPTRVWLSGTQPRPGDCRTESHVQRALCQ